jgi:FMN phosphatase YigB (HAD superfamily)
VIRILMIDLGETLIDKHKKVYPHVPEALETIKGLETGTAERLHLCLVSDYYEPTPEKTVDALFTEYVELLKKVKLVQFFEPVEQHVTLSTHAGVSKPDPQIFKLAIKRLGLTAGLDECLFITENEEHIAACHDLGMKTLRFIEPEGGMADFSDWSKAPQLIAQLVNP